MKFKLINPLKAFTMAEVMISIMIMSVLAMATIGINKSRTTYINKYMYYSAFTNLTAGIGELIAAGCTATDVTNGICATTKTLPIKGHDAVNSRGLCDRIVDIFNTVGTINCNLTTAPANYTDSNLNFTTTNGARYFGFGVDPVSSVYTVYIDIDGKSRNATLNQDVMKFFVQTDGTIYPDSSTANIGPNNTNYLSASVSYVDSSGNTIWLERGVTYKQAVCDAKGVYYAAVSCSINPTCSTNICSVTTDKPGY